MVHLVFSARAEQFIRDQLLFPGATGSKHPDPQPSCGGFSKVGCEAVGWMLARKQVAGLARTISLITLTLFVIESWRPGQFGASFCRLPAINMHQPASERLKEAANLLDIYHALFPANKQILSLNGPLALIVRCRMQGAGM